MGYVYYSDPINNGVMPTGVDLGIKMAGSVGTVIGQITFGVLIDKFGRKKAIPGGFRAG
jgi:MFS family permease